MSKATEITMAARNAPGAADSATRAGAIADQYWLSGAVMYVFDDKSVMVVSGSKFTAFASSREASTAPLNEIMG